MRCHLNLASQEICVYTRSLLQQKWGKSDTIMRVRQKCGLEAEGIDPPTSRMQSERSTI